MNVFPKRTLNGNNKAITRKHKPGNKEQTEWRKYPSYPNCYLIHLVTGAVAAALGAFITPAIITKDFIVVTFLTPAIQQFRDVRKVEKESLKDLEATEYTYRGDAYIDGIAKTFDRGIILLSLSPLPPVSPWNSPSENMDRSFGGFSVGLGVFFFFARFSKGKKVRDIAEVKEGQIEVKDHELFVDGIFVSNLLGIRIIVHSFSTCRLESGIPKKTYV